MSKIDVGKGTHFAKRRCTCTATRRTQCAGTRLLQGAAAALAPVCADKFRALPDGEAKAVALSKVDSWKRRDEFPKEIVTLPGESYPSSALVDACSTLLLAPKSAALN